MRISPPIAVCTLIAAALGIIGFGRWYGGDCAFDPSGQIHWLDGIKDKWIGKDCDPWRFVEPDASIKSITIEPYSNWNMGPARTVTIQSDGTLKVEEPLDREATRYRVVASLADLHLATKLLSSLSRYTRFNRRTNEVIEMFAMGLPPTGPMSDILTYNIDPQLRCLTPLFDGGGISLTVVAARGATWRTALDSYCSSPAMESALHSAWDVHIAVFKRANYRGEPFVEELANPRP